MPMLSVKQVAEQLGVSEAGVRSLINRRKLKASDFSNGGKRCFRINSEWLADFIANEPLPTPEIEMDSLLSVQQVSEKLGVSPKKVRELIVARRLNAIDLAKPWKQHCYRIKPEWVNDFIANSELPPLKVRVKPKQGLRPSKFAASREQLLNGLKANRD